MKYVFFFYVLFFCNPLFAQLPEMRIEGKPQKIESEIVAVKDANDRFCAGIQVNTNLEGLGYDSYNGVVRVDRQPGRDMVYLPPDERVLEIFKAGYKPLKIILADISVYLQPKEVWAIEIFGDDFHRILHSDKGKFILLTEPPGAIFEIDGLPIQGTTPYYSEEFSAHTFKILISKDRYEPAEIILNVKKDTVITEKIRLTPKFGLMKILNVSGGTELYIEGRRHEFSPNKALQVDLGQTDISLRKKYFKNFELQVDVTPNDSPEKSIVISPEFVRIKTKLTVESNVRGADVYLNDKRIGTTPLETEIAAGLHAVKIKKEDYRSETREFEIKTEQPEAFYFDMSKLGIVNIKGTRAANVYIDGDYLGQIPVQDARLSPGKYKLKIVKDGYDTKRATITVKPKKKTFKFNLVRSDGKFLRISAFGNKRVSQVFDGFRMSIGYSQMPLPERLTDEFDYLTESINFDLGFNATPWIFNIGVDVWAHSDEFLQTYDLDKEKQGTNGIFHTSLNFVPFVLFERFYPAVGIVYRGGLLNDTFNFAERKWFDDFGVSYMAIIKLGKRRDGSSNYFVKFGYEEYFNREIFENYWQFNIGMTFSGNAKK